jgi:Protein of unknown function (DUF1524)
MRAHSIGGDGVGSRYLFALMSGDLRRRRPGASRSVRWVIAIAVIALALALVAIAVVRNGDDDPSPGARAAPALAPAAVVTTTPAVVTLPSGIAALRIADPTHQDTYSRNLFGSGWIDTDHDCQNTRAEVLIDESRVPVAFTSPTDCTVATGDWLDPWSGSEITSAHVLDIDHTVPLANAWRSGAWAWSADERRAYANDLTDVGHLIALALGENRSKGDDGPEAWKPPNPATWCAYARDWTAIKARWNLTASTSEWSALVAMSSTCS